MTPPGGLTVAASTPASRSAALFTTALCKSLR